VLKRKKKKQAHFCGLWRVMSHSILIKYESGQLLLAVAFSMLCMLLTIICLKMHFLLFRRSQSSNHCWHSWCWR